MGWVPLELGWVDDSLREGWLDGKSEGRWMKEDGRRRTEGRRQKLEDGDRRSEVRKGQRIDNGDDCLTACGIFDRLDEFASELWMIRMVKTG